MKFLPSFLLSLISMLFFISCDRSSREGLSEVDQTLEFYIQDAQRHDLLVPDDSLGFAGRVHLFDLNADRLNVPVNGVSSGLDSLSGKYFLQYIGGATRVLTDSVEASRTYRSDMLMTLKKGMQASVADSDTVQIFYSRTADAFQVSRVNYNRQLIFTKIPGQPNRVVITK